MAAQYDVERHSRLWGGFKTFMMAAAVAVVAALVVMALVLL